MAEKRSTDDVTVWEARMNMVKRHGILGVLIVLAPTVAQPVWDYANSLISNRQAEAVHNEIQPFYKILEDIQLSLMKNRSMIISSVGKIKLTPKDIDYIARMAVARQSIIKVREIRSYMYTLRDGKIDLRKEIENDRFRLKIREILIRNCKVYQQDLNRYTNENIGLIGDYIYYEFPMEDFLKRVYWFLELNDPIDVRCDYLLDYMVDDIQPEFFSKMFIKMSEEI